MKRIVINSLLYLSVALSGAATAAGDENLQQYRESLAGARSTFNADMAHCKALQADERDMCRAQAKAVHKKANAEAIAHQRNTAQARVDARIATADADYDLARAGCKATRGNERDACLQQAKAQRVAATTDAMADLKVTQARNKAKEQKRKSYYRASREKCDALAGAARQACMTLARAQYGE
jgi:hypothetical protein